MFGNRMATMDQESDFPDISITRWGEPATVALDKKFKKAQKYWAAKKQRKAIQEYGDLVDWAVKKEQSLGLFQYLYVLLHTAYCHSELNEFDKANEIYLAREIIIKQEDEWFKVLPAGLTLLVAPFIKEVMLAENYLERAIGFTNVNQYDNFVDAITRAARYRASQGHYEKGLQCCHFYFQKAREHEKREDMLRAADLVTEVFQGELPDDIQTTVHNMKILAYNRPETFSDMREEMKKLIAFKEEINDPDIDEDRRRLAELEGLLERQSEES